MVIDCHGHYTTAPKELQAFRDTQIAALADPRSAASTGPSGNVSLMAPRVAVLDGAAILAQADNGQLAGNVTLAADDHFNGNAADLLFNYKERETRAEVNVGNATIKANDINVTSLASNLKVTEIKADVVRNSRAIATADFNRDGKLDQFEFMKFQSLQDRAYLARVASDSAITTKVRAALLLEPNVDSLDVGVETYKGGVLLSGFVKDETQRRKAVQAAAAVRGVTSVKDGMAVR